MWNNTRFPQSLPDQCHFTLRAWLREEARPVLPAECSGHPSVTRPAYFKCVFYLMISKYIPALLPIAVVCRQEGFSLFTHILGFGFF